MQCPVCGENNDKVIDSRYNESRNWVRRRRECISCGCRFTTYEIIITDAATKKTIMEELDALREEAAMKKEVERILVSTGVPFTTKDGRVI